MVHDVWHAARHPGLRHQDHELGALTPMVLGDEVERLREPAGGVERGGGGEGEVGGVAGGVDGSCDLAARARLGPVVGELTGPGEVVLGSQLLERLGRLAVEAGPASGRQLLVQRRAHQRVREPVTADARLLDQVGGDGGVEAVEHVVLVEPGHHGEHVEVEARTDHRARLEDPLGLVRQHRQTAADHVPHPFGQNEALDARHPGAVALGDRSRLAEVAEDLADEERVPGRLLVEGGGEFQPVGRQLVTRRRRHELDDLVGVETLQGDALDLASAAQLGQHGRQGVATVDIGVAVGAEHQQVGHGLVDRDVAHEQQRPVVAPVQVVEHEQHGLTSGGLAEPAAHRVEQLRPLGVGLGHQRRRQPGDERVEIGHQPAQLTGERAEGGRPARGAQLGPQRLGERLVGRADELVAAPREDKRAVVVLRPAGDLGGEAGLAHAGFAGKQYDLRAPVDHRLPVLDNAGQRPIAPGEGEGAALGERRRQVVVVRRFGDAIPLDLVGGDGFVETLQRQLAGGAEAVAAPPPAERPHDRRTEDLPGGGCGLEALGLDHRQTEAVAVLRGHVTDRNADANQQRRVGMAPVLDVERLLDADRGRDRVACPLEGGHHAVTGVLHDPAVVLDDSCRDQAIVALAQTVRLFLAHPHPQRGRVDEVGEHHRERLDLRWRCHRLHAATAVTHHEAVRGNAQPRVATGQVVEAFDRCDRAMARSDLHGPSSIAPCGTLR